MKTLTSPRNTKVKMIQDWTPEQFKAIDKAIAKYFRNKTVDTHKRTVYFNAYVALSFDTIDNEFGFAYTSSGMFACYSVCNVTAYFDADHVYHYEFFTIGEDGNFYAILWDNEENELCIEIQHTTK